MQIRRAAASVVVAGVALAATVSGVPAGAQEPFEPGPPQAPFLCTTLYQGLGQPIVDNQDRRGTPVYPESAPDVPDMTQDPVGWSEQCQAEPRTIFRYRNTAGDLIDIPTGVTAVPADAMLLPVDDLLAADEMSLGDATEVPYLIATELGTLPGTRFIYAITMLVDPVVLDPASAADPIPRWNRRLVFSFSGGVGIGHSQGGISTGDSTLDEALRLGDAVLYTTGNRTSTHYDLLLAGRTAVEAKGLFVDRYGEPLYTVGIGGSGGGIQQYVFAQNHPDLLDALIPQYSYPDMTTQTINVGDCELLAHYMDELDADNERWQDWDNRELLEGQNTLQGFESDWQELTDAPGSTECIEGWRGSTPLAMNPTFGLAAEMDQVVLPYVGEILARQAAGEPAYPEDFPDLGRLLRTHEDPEQWVDWTHWQDVVDVYGVDDESGYANVPWDNVGVQYGLRSVAQGLITPEEFLDVNARVGTWAEPEDNVPESCGLVEAMIGAELRFFAQQIGICEGDELDEHSARQMIFSEDATEPAPRREGDVEAITAAIESGLLFSGEVPEDVPVLDARHYLEDQLDMHNAHQSFVVRERLRRAGSNLDNHVIWFLDARPEEDDEATSALFTEGFRLMDEWVLAIQAGSDERPTDAVDRCFETDGTEIARGEGVWDGAVELVLSGEGDWSDEAPAEVDGVEVGACAAAFPLHSTSRIIAGGPITADVYKCQLQPVADAVDAGLYGEWAPSGDEVEQLEAIFPDGVCDYTQLGVGDPRTFAAPGQEGEGDDDGGGDGSESSSGDSDSGAVLVALIAALVVAALVGLSMLGKGGSGDADGGAAHR